MEAQERPGPSALLVGRAGLVPPGAPVGLAGLCSEAPSAPRAARRSP